MDFVDLRSDTVTKPTLAMRKAMAKAAVGDDVLGEDPTVQLLEEMAAERMGKQAGLFVPSGTMGNLIATLVHCRRGDEAIMGDRGHTFLFEAGGVSALGGVVIHTLPNQPDGTLTEMALKAALRPDDVHHPVSRLLILENTHNRCGGVALSTAYMDWAGQFAHENNLALHVDGARIFNAAIALGVSAAELVQQADSVTFCLSKGLCAPVGSVLCGSKEFIRQARRVRKQLGGGMRQAGVIAAAGIVALEQMVDRLGEDHLRAFSLAEGLKAMPGVTLPMGIPQTNMVFAALPIDFPRTAAQVAAELSKLGVRVGVVGEHMFRMVTHYWIDDDGIQKTLDAFRQTLAKMHHI
jgi:threonine aldolase